MRLLSGGCGHRDPRQVLPRLAGREGDERNRRLVVGQVPLEVFEPFEAAGLEDDLLPSVFEVFLRREQRYGLIDDANGERRRRVDHETRLLYRRVAAEVHPPARAGVEQRVVILPYDELFDDRSRGDGRQRRAEDAVVAEDVERLIARRRLGDRLRIEVADRAALRDDARGDHRLVFVPRRPLRLDGRPVVDRGLIDHAID